MLPLALLVDCSSTSLQPTHNPTIKQTKQPSPLEKYEQVIHAIIYK
jgi:hypothetical protein